MTIDLTTDCDTKRVTETPSKTEIEKLEDLIKERHPGWHIEVEPCYEGQKLILVLHDRYVCDVVCHYYSYGGREGLLEFMADDDSDPVGWLSAEEALILFEEAMEKNR